MDGSSERACFVLGVSLHYADRFSQCGHYVGSKTPQATGEKQLNILNRGAVNRRVFVSGFSAIRSAKGCNGVSDPSVGGMNGPRTYLIFLTGFHQKKTSWTVQKTVGFLVAQ